MNRLVLPLALMLAACTNDTSLSAVDARVAVTPGLVDLDPTVVGADVPFTLTLEHLQGVDVKILSVDLLNVQGEAFNYDGPTEFDLPRTESIDLEFSYHPTEAGFHIAGILFTTNARESTVQVEARGSARIPALQVFPAALDMGPVTPPDVRTRNVVIQNEGDVPIDLTSAIVSDTRFAFEAALPLTIEAGTQITAPVSFTPVSNDPVTGQLDLRVGDLSLGTVLLRGNDCVNGTPSLYDVDFDGWTSCGGDCDDNEASVHPGANEIFDQVDQDCDNTIDEGTAGYDDDGDGYCDDAALCSDGSTPGDCNDGAAAVSPAASEVDDNGIDDDCDGAIDAGSVDGDADGYAISGGDCDDTDGTVFPGAPEQPDGLDNDCDTLIDEGTALGDDDGDGFCEDATACSDGSTPGDCDDGLPTSFPGAPEVADGADNNCDGTVDEGTPNYDNDGDGFSAAGGDCDDNDPLVNPAYGNC